MGKISIKNKSTIVVIIIVSIGFFVAGFLSRSAYDNIQESNAKKAGSSFIDSVLSGDTEAAYRLTSSDFREDQTQDQFSELLSGIKVENPNKLEGSVLKGNGRTLFVQYVDGLPPLAEGNTAAEFYVGLVKEGKDWKVASVSIQ